MEEAHVAQVIRAVYEQGRLRPLDPVNLVDGEETRLAILSEREQVHMALADILAPVATLPSEEDDEAAIFSMLDEELQGQTPISDVILEERREGP